MNNSFVPVGEDMVWPSIKECITDIAWKLRWSPNSLTFQDKVVAASVISAYRDLVSTTQKKRNLVCREIQKDYRTEPTAHQEDNHAG